MTVKEIAKRFRVPIQNVYTIIYNLEVVEGLEIPRKGRRLVIDEEMYKLICQKLRDHGYVEHEGG